MTSEKVNELQIMQQNLQTILIQKQQLESQINEITSALAEIDHSEKTFRIMGKIMVSASKEKIKEELEKKNNLINIRLQNFSKQEDSLNNNINKLRKEVIGEKNE